MKVLKLLQKKLCKNGYIYVYIYVYNGVLHIARALKKSHLMQTLKKVKP